MDRSQILKVSALGRAGATVICRCEADQAVWMDLIAHAVHQSDHVHVYVSANAAELILKSCVPVHV